MFCVFQGVYFAKGSCNKGVPQRQTASAFAVELCFGQAECNYQHEEPKGESKGKGPC